MKKIKKIKIRVNGKVKTLQYRTKLSKLVKTLKLPIKKVAIEVNQEIVDKKKLDKILLKNNDKIEIVHFIGGG
jgi:thiamine biosynthesis protein ThiS